VTDYIICDDRIEAGDLVVRTDLLKVIEDPEASERWGAPIGDDLRPVEESADRQYSHIGCLAGDR
jgi:hypothetical protein